MVEQVFDVVGDLSQLPRDLALKAADMIQVDPDSVARLRAALQGAEGSPVSVNCAFHAFVTEDDRAAAPETATSPRPGLEGRKVEFRAGGYKCTVKGREVRLLSPEDLVEIDEDRLQRALEAFRLALDSD